MRNFILVILFLVLCVTFSYAQEFNMDDHVLPDNVTIDVYIFHGQGCPHCAKALAFFEEILPKYDHVKFYEKEVYFNEENRELFEQFCREHNSSVQGVPTIFVDDRMFVGFNKAIGEQIESEIQSCIIEKCEVHGPDGQVNEPEPRDMNPSDPGTERYHSLIGSMFLILIGLVVLVYLTKYVIKIYRREKRKIKQCERIISKREGGKKK